MTFIYELLDQYCREIAYTGCALINFLRKGVRKLSFDRHRQRQVTCGHFRSRDKDGGNIIRSAVIEKPMLCANLMALSLSFIEPELWMIKVYMREWAFWTFRFLLPWPWPDDLHIRAWPILPGDIPDVQMNFVRQLGFQRLSSDWHRNTHTDIIESTLLGRCSSLWSVINFRWYWGPLFGEFAYLLIRTPNARCLVADDCLVSMVWYNCKDGFQRWRSNFDEKFVHF